MMEWRKLRYCYKMLTFWWIIGIIVGIFVGIILKAALDLTVRQIYLLGFVGHLFIRLMTMISVPLLASFVTYAIANLDKAISPRVQLQCLCYFCIMLLESAGLGLLIAILIPRKASSRFRFKKLNVTIEDNLFDLGRNVFPRNLLEMFVYTYRTELIPNPNETDIRKWEIGHTETMVDHGNILGIAMFSILFGTAIRKLGNSGLPLKDLIESLTKFSLLIMKWILYIAPLGFASLIAEEITMINGSELAKHTGMYLLAIFVCHCMQCFIIFPLIYIAFLRTNPLRMFGYKIVLTSFVTGSSLATMPVAMDYFSNQMLYDPRIVSFVFSVGINTNKLGSAEAYAAAATFVATWSAMKVENYHYILIYILSIVASIASPGIPLGLVVVLSSVLEGTGIPVHAAILVYSVEFIVDRFTTLVNVFGNCLALAIIQHYNELPEELKEIKEMEEDIEFQAGEVENPNAE